MLIYFSLFFFIATLISWIFLVLKYSKKKTISKEKNILFTRLLKSTTAQVSLKEKIINYDKLYHKILNELWYVWTFGEVLKWEPKEIRDRDKIWKLHKLRNKIVHDFDSYEERYLERQSQEYKKEIQQLLKWISE